MMQGLDEFSKLINFKPRSISYILYKLADEKKYTEFTISKRSGGERTISAPTGKLKQLQRNLVAYLEEIEKPRCPPFVHGFVKGKSIETNARQHRNERWVLNLDLHDFFGTINFGRVRGILIKHRYFLFDESVATLIAQTCCYKNSLPQGAPTSPIISNIVTRPLDFELVSLAKKYGCRYTRFADDITFSTNKAQFPEQLAKPSTDTLHKWELGAEIKEAIKKAGFKENPKKTRLQYFQSRQEVTGLVVNKRINVTREYRKTVRAMVHRLVTKGELEIKSPSQYSIDDQSIKKVDPLCQLQGMLGFIDTIDFNSNANANKKNLSSEDRKIFKNKAYKNNDLTSQEKQYRRFLLYRNLFTASKPIVLTEGITDKIHLRCAAKKLKTAYPNLEFRISPCERKRTKALMGLTDGAANLSQFIWAYKNETSEFNKSSIGEPIIVLVDKDDGWSQIGATIKKMQSRKENVDGSEDFYFICINLYVVCMPLPPDKQTCCIEDLYTQKTFKTKIGEKSFSTLNNAKFDKNSHYGKKDG